MGDKRPNIIIFNPDEMRFDTMGHMGNPAAYTPNIDSFVKNDAVSFRNAYCQNPVCVPSRCSFFTGLYPHTMGHRTMNYLLHSEEKNLFGELKNAGYYVWMNARNDLVAGQISGLAESQADEIYYFNKEQKPKPIDLSEMAKETNSGNAFPYSFLKGVSEKEYGSDSLDVKAAIDKIEKFSGDSKPFCVFLGLNNPHPPYIVEKKYYDLIDPEKIRERIRFSETDKKSRMIQELKRLTGLEDFPEEKWLEVQRIYLAMCAMIDDLFGQVMDTLKRTDQYDNTLILFLSDHGDFAGDYDLPEKAQNTFEQCLTKVPFLVKPPKGEKVDCGIADGLVELVDFYATVMDYAKVTPEHDHFGISLRTLIEDRNSTIRKYAFCEGGRRPNEIHCDEYHTYGPMGPDDSSEYWAKLNAQKDPLTHEKGTMITDGRVKYVKRLSGENEFYDLIKDPEERENIYDRVKESSQVQILERAMLQWYQETCDIVPYEYDSRFTEERLWALARNVCPPHLEDKFREYARTNYDAHTCMRYAFSLLIQDRKAAAQNHPL